MDESEGGGVPEIPLCNYFSVTDRAEWVPEIIFPMQHDENLGVDVGVFFVSLGE